MENSLTISSLTSEQLTYIKNLVMMDDLKKQYKTISKQSDFREDIKLSLWLSDVSDKSKTVYMHAITLFKEFLETSNLHWNNFTSFDADSYIEFLKTKNLSANSILIYVSGVSSFCTQLVRWNDLETNPFKGTKKKPKKTRSKELVIPSNEDINVVLDSYMVDLKANGRGADRKKVAARRMFCIVTLMKDYGFRIGAFENMVWDEEGKFTTISKGKKIVGKFTEETVELLQSFGYYDTISCKTDSIKKAFGYKMNDLGMPYSPHDIRHRFAVNFYEVNKDIYALKEALFHEVVTTTENYLHSLKLK